MIRKSERKNAEMAIVIAGMKRQNNEDNNSISSDVHDLPVDGRDFFEDADG
jgi:hypothetical protein